MNGPNRDSENVLSRSAQKKAIDHLALIPPADLTAFPLDDIHGYRKLARRVGWTVLIGSSVAAICLIVLLIWKPTP